MTKIFAIIIYIKTIDENSDYYIYIYLKDLSMQEYFCNKHEQSHNRE